MWSGQTLHGRMRPGSISVGKIALDQSSTGLESVGSTNRGGAKERRASCSWEQLSAMDWFRKIVCATRPRSSGGVLGQGNSLLGIDVVTVSIWKTSEICEAVEVFLAPAR